MEKLWTAEEIKKYIDDEWSWIKNEKYIEDAVNELIDGILPIYYSDIIDTWKELPNEYSNRYHELITELPDNIYTIMTTDLYLYYSMLFDQALTAKQEQEINLV